MKKIVVCGGGTGTFVVLSGLKEFTSELTAVVSMADSGGSTGRLRDELGVLPPGDVRQALVALSRSSDELRQLLNYRFENGGLSGHSFGNIMLSAMEKVTGDFEKGLAQMSELLNIQGRVVPITTRPVHLVARFIDETVIKGQDEVYEHQFTHGTPVKKLWLEPEAEVNPNAVRAILKADLITIGPGCLYTSILPLFLVKGMVAALRKTNAKIVYIANLMTEPGQTEGFSVQDLTQVIIDHIKRPVDFVVYNTKKPELKLVKKYRLEREREPVEFDPSKVDLPYFPLGTELLANGFFPKKASDTARRSLIRHDPKKLAKMIMTLSEYDNVLKVLDQKLHTATSR